MSGATAAYAFLPWVRRGMASAIGVADTGQADQPSAASLQVQLSVDGSAVQTDVRIYGPGDVTSIDPRAVVRTEPTANAADFEPNYLAAIEFSQPDLPWLFTPLAPDAGNHLRPWICLVVVEDTDGVTISAGGSGPTVLTVTDPAGQLPDLADSWAWAHAQVSWAPDPAASSDQLDAELLGLLGQGSSQAISRLVCPRQLRPGTRYHACVVPAFEAGREAGLGLPVTTTDLTPAWTIPAAGAAAQPVTLPVYVHWDFATGQAGDFESLVMPLWQHVSGATGPAVGPVVGTEHLDVSQLVSGAAAVDLEGALSQLGFTPAPLAADVQAALQGALASPPQPGQPPVVAPPVYGGWYAGQPAPPPPQSSVPPGWLWQLNLDPRYRVAAGLGVLVVQNQAEQLVAAAWDQLTQIEQANQALAQAQLARSASAVIHEAHLSPLPDGTLLQITSPVHAQVTTSPTTLASQITGSLLPDGVVSPAFRRISRPQGPLARRLTAGTAGQALSFVDGLNQGTLEVAAARGTPDGTVSMTVVGQVRYPGSPPGEITDVTVDEVDNALGWSPATHVSLGSDLTWGGDQADASIPVPPRFSGLSDADFTTMSANFQQAARAHQAYLATALSLAAWPPQRPPLAALTGHVLTQLNPAVTVPAATAQRLQAPAAAWQRPDPLDPVRDTPLVSYPMYRPLAELAEDMLLPGVAGVPPDSVALLQTNSRFLEAYLVGANHEMARQLLWRGFPTLPLATFFTAFWGAGADDADIPPIAGWDPSQPLGDNALSWAAEPLVLLVRSAVFRRYPTASVYAAKAVLSGNSRVPGDEERYWFFSGHLDPDITYLGFDLSKDDALGNTGDGLGWFFVIQQHLTEPRFGLEPDGAFGTDPTGWDTASWSSLAATAPGLASMVNLPVTWPRHGGALTLGGQTWGQDSDAAQFATILLRQPVRVAIHATALLGG